MCFSCVCVCVCVCLAVLRVLVNVTRVLTCERCHRSGLRINPSGRCLGVRDASGAYQWQTYREVAARVSNVGSALRARGAVKVMNESASVVFPLTCARWHAFS